MTWVRTDDSMPLHPKLLKLSDGAFRLWCNALHFANRGVTNGKIDKALVPSLNHHGLWSPKQLAGFVAELVGGLWVDAADHYLIHDYAHHQAEAMSDRVERKRAIDREKQRQKRLRDDEKAMVSLGMSPGDIPTETKRQERRSPTESSVPTRPDPTRPEKNTSCSVAREVGHSEVVALYSRLRSEAHQAKHGRPGGRYIRGSKDWQPVEDLAAFARENGLEALEDSLRGYLSDPWAIDATWPMAGWARDPGRYMGKGGEPASSEVDRLQSEILSLVHAQNREPDPTKREALKASAIAKTNEMNRLKRGAA